MNWYYAIEGRSQGPVTESSLKRLVREGKIDGGALVWHPGLEEWGPLAKLNPEVAAQMNKGAAAGRSDGKSGSEHESTGVLKRIFGRRKKN